MKLLHEELLVPRIRTIFASDLSDRQAVQVPIDGRAPVALYRLGETFYATDDVCTHGEASLSDGDIDGHEIICPFHLGAFDIRSGEATRPPCVVPLRIYGVVVDADGVVAIDID